MSLSKILCYNWVRQSNVENKIGPFPLDSLRPLSPTQGLLTLLFSLGNLDFLSSSLVIDSITMNKANGGDGIPAKLFQILKDDAVKVLHSTCQQIWKTQQQPRDWRRSVFISIPKKGNVKNVQVIIQLHSFHRLAK